MVLNIPIFWGETFNGAKYTNIFWETFKGAKYTNIFWGETFNGAKYTNIFGPPKKYWYI